MHAQIDQRAAAGAGLVAEPAARATLAAQVGRLGIVNIAKVAVIDEVLQNGAVVAEAAHEADHEELAVLFGGFLHTASLIGVHGHGLFAQYMLAGVERGDGALGMSRVPGAHAYRVQLGEFNHFVNVGEQAGHAVFLGAALHRLFIYIAQRVYLDVGVERICAQMHARNVTVADNAYFEFLIH